jgi:hypothetical protein
MSRNLRSRLARLERAKPSVGRKTFHEVIDDFMTVRNWLAERGYPDHLAAIEAGETGPEGLEGLLREQAAHDPRRRAWTRFQMAINGQGLMDDADLRLIVGSRRPMSP